MPATLQRVYGSPGHQKPPKFYREGDSQAYLFGDLVTLSSNKVAALAAADTAIDSTGAKVLGQVLRAGRNTTGNTAEDVPVHVVDDENLLVLPFWHTSGASSSEYRDASEGLACTLRNVGGTWVAAIGVTSNANIVLIKKIPGTSDTETYAAGYFKVLAASRFFG